MAEDTSALDGLIALEIRNNGTKLTKRGALDILDAGSLVDDPVGKVTKLTLGSASGFVFRPNGTTGGNVYATFESLFDALDTTKGPQTIWVDLSLADTPNQYSVPGRSSGTYDFRGEIELRAPLSGSAIQDLQFQDQVTNLRKIAGPIRLTSDINSGGDPVVEVAALFEIGEGAAIAGNSGKGPVLQWTGNGVLYIRDGATVNGSAGNEPVEVDDYDLEVRVFDEATLADDAVANNGAGSPTLTVKPFGLSASPGVTHTNHGGTITLSLEGLGANVKVAYSPANYTPADDSLEAHLEAIDAALAP